MFVYLQNSSLVVTAVAIVGSTENGSYFVIVLELITFSHELMGPCYHFETVSVIELLGDVLKNFFK